MTVPRISNIDPTRRIRRNELNSDGFCFYIAFVPQEVYVVTTRIDKPIPWVYT
jgi:hypothetical protein